MGMESGGFDAPQPMSRKRKAASQENERLSKRLSLLNIGRSADSQGASPAWTNDWVEKDGARLYVPVESPHVGENTFTNYKQSSVQSYTTPTHAQYDASAQAPTPTPTLGDNMMLDNSKHKVYIYNLDDELSSESEDESGKLVFLSDIEKHLRANRIPQHVLPNTDGELAGMQLVLYREPTSLTVPEEQDNVRRAVVEARERLREQQRARREGLQHGTSPGQMQIESGHMGSEQDAHMHMERDPDAMDLS